MQYKNQARREESGIGQSRTRSKAPSDLLLNVWDAAKFTRSFDLTAISIHRMVIMSSHSRMRHLDVPGASEILSPEFLDFLAGLDDKLREQVMMVRTARAERLHAALRNNTPPAALPASEATIQLWQVPALPAPLTLPGIEISGPASIASMMVQALNPGPEGKRAAGYLDDDEDSGGHSLADTVAAAHNRKAAVEGTLSADDPQRGKSYRVEPGPLPFFMHR